MEKDAAKKAFIPIGIALIVIGINNNNAFIGVGALFLIIGLASVLRKKKADEVKKGDRNE
jgi:LPXTG-motif cell wall-anchored protein